MSVGLGPGTVVQSSNAAASLCDEFLVEELDLLPENLGTDYESLKLLESVAADSVQWNKRQSILRLKQVALFFLSLFFLPFT